MLKVIAKICVIFLYISTSHASTQRVVTNFGTLHDFMLEKPDFNVAHFIHAIKKFRPQLILTEARKTHPGAINGAIDGGIEQAIVYAVAVEIGAKVIAVDEWDHQFFINNKDEETRAAADEEFQALLAPNYEARVADIMASNWSAINEADQSLVKEYYQIHDQFNYNVFWIKRNEAICANSKAALAQTKAKKVMSIFGLDHKYYLDNCLEQAGETIVHAPNWSQSEELLNAKQDTKDVIVQNLLGAKIKLHRRLEQRFYTSPIMHDHFKAKLEMFDAWIDVVREL